MRLLDILKKEAIIPELSGKRKKEAAALLGIPNYQTLSKRLEKYGID